MSALPDVNFLAAMLDPQHLHHPAAHHWFEAHGHLGWATCPITENGCIRVLTQPAYPGGSFSVRDITHRLSVATAAPEHAFWPDAVSILDAAILDTSAIHGPGQLTDAYLLALCAHRGGRLVTFDRSVPTRAVRESREDNLVVLAGDSKG